MPKLRDIVAGVLVLGAVGTVIATSNARLKLQADARYCVENNYQGDEVTRWREEPCSRVLEVAEGKGLVRYNKEVDTYIYLGR